MSMVLTRSPLEVISMNGAGTSKRRSARLSHEGVDDNEPPMKRSRANGGGAQATTVGTKEQDGDANALARRRPRKVYEEEVDGFAFKKGGRKAKDVKQPAGRNGVAEKQSPAKDREAMPPPPAPVAPAAAQPQAPVSAPSEDTASKPVVKKVRRRFPTTPEREAAEKPKRRSKRLSNEGSSSDPTAAPSPLKPSHAKSHGNTERSPSPDKARPVTVEKKRKRGANGLEEEEKIMRIVLPFQDTPVIRRNKEMRKSSADGNRRSSSGMRGKRASSLIDEGRGNALPHAEVPEAEFFKHISADLTEPRRMRCLLGWCGTRALPPKPDAPKDSSPASSMEFQALQAARVIQEELSQDLVTKGTLSDWFSRDETVVPKIPLRKKPNPRNIANAAKAEELEKELERLKKERADWDTLMKSALSTPPPAESGAEDEQHVLSPVNLDLLDSPERAIFEQLQAPTTEIATDSTAIQQRLQHVAENLEFSVDQFAHGVHALSTTRNTAEKLAERTLAEAADMLDEREKARRQESKGADALDALRALGKVLNGRRR
ncbi:hypothetical protein LTR78_007691 [Recurvomyces mirabilis]|uniref:Uncharacterized protein n=1 Tax=Recurvomyces mirabilis TaxID=574656 RepID=A0AAE0TRD7_9PEZI|nr:hypothetical protein LTR78_007691 [Recurvomyces mirabilis]KAK5151578.1 hypothetical protein LTS14_009065 [Recurvomyces mirabilis]